MTQAYIGVYLSMCVIVCVFVFARANSWERRFVIVANKPAISPLPGK